MHSYPGLSYRAAMELPIRTFWLLNSNIDRISAQKDLRSLSIAVHGQTGEAAQEHRNQLFVEVGSIVKLESDNPLKAERDESGFAELRAMANT